MKNRRLSTKRRLSGTRNRTDQTPSSPSVTDKSGTLRHHVFTWPTDKRVKWLRATIAIALVCGFCFSWKLWISSRLFPLSPISELLPRVPFPFDYIWFFALLASLLSIIIAAQSRRLILVFLGLAVLLSLWDQNRWQPWFYQWLLMLASLGFYYRKSSELEGQQLALNSCRLIIASTYLWSGFQKLNANFIKETWPDISSSLLHFLPSTMRKLPTAVVLAIPILEIAIALGLIMRRYRSVAVAFAITTHVFVLALLVASGENTTVWPWNIAMILFVVILFWQEKETTPRQIIAPTNWFHAVVLLLVLILPALSLVDLWDSYLSAALYSGNTDQAVIYVSPKVINQLPTTIHPHIWQSSQPFFLDINRWSYGELNVPLYPEPRVYKKVAERICIYAADSSSDVTLRIKEKPNPLTAHRESEFYDCDHLD